MPKVEYVEPAALPPRRQTRGDAFEARLEAREHLRQAIKAGKALRLSLNGDERDVSVKQRYSAAAKEEGYRVRFQTLESRPYQTRSGTMTSEASVLAVLIMPEATGTKAK